VFFSVFSKNPGNSTLCLERVKKVKKSENFKISKSKSNFSGGRGFWGQKNGQNLAHFVGKTGVRFLTHSGAKKSRKK